MLSPKGDASTLPNSREEWIFHSPEVSIERCICFGEAMSPAATYAALPKDLSPYQESPIPCENFTTNECVSCTPPYQEDIISCTLPEQQDVISCTHPHHLDVISEERTTESDALLLTLENVVKTTFPQLKASVNKSSCGAGILCITHSQMHLHPPAGYVYRVRFVVTCNNDGFYYEQQVLFHTICNGTFSSNEEFVGLCKSLLKSNGYVFCPGIDYTKYIETYYSVIRFHCKQVDVTETPFQRVNAKGCLWWFQLPRNAMTEEKIADEVCCSYCKRLRSDLEHQKKRSALVSPAKRVKRQAANSNYPNKYLSPPSAVKRKTNVHKKNFKLRTTLARHSDADVTLDDVQHDEMCKIVKEMERDDSGKLDEIFKEAASHDVEDSLREVWQMDQQRREFMKDQIKNATVRCGNRWNLVTIRIALAVYSRSPAAYDALKSFNILRLPSRSTMQAYTSCFLHEGGSSWECISKQVSMYEKFKLECREARKPIPMSDGVLIFDEAKVISRLLWNSRSQTIIGLAMTAEDQSSLHDIYQQFSSDDKVKQTSYVLQFLWRDLTSEFDIIGPYYCSHNSFSAKFIHACLLDTIQLFQIHGFATSTLVCDGASTNMAVIKSTHGCSGAYGFNPQHTDPYAVEPWFTNPFNPPLKIFWLICPSHQLKNMINALHSSRDGGNRKLTLDGHQFGWKVIADMYERECQRVRSGNARMVPKLREVHIIRDSWTKLNVSPAKIMQQEQVLGELFHYISQNPPDTAEAKATFQYLESCHKLFEKGYLSHDRIWDSNAEILKSMNEGYLFFTEWHKSLIKLDGAIPNNQFLAWQTWDLLRICIYGFRGFCNDFLHRHQGYFISPLRLSGSAVETLFSQYKRLAGGKLDAANYATARAAQLIQQTVTPHHSGSDYRDCKLHMANIELERKKYGRPK